MAFSPFHATTRKPGDAAHLAQVLIVDDSLVARSVLGRMVASSGRFHVAAALSNVPAALDFLQSNRVDVILLDLEMPGIDGLTALPDMIQAGGGAKVLIVSSAADEGAAASVQALALGAADTLVKPGIGAFGGRFAEVLSERLTRLLGGPADAAPLGGPSFGPMPATGEFDIVAIGASTGGIHALGQLLRGIPQDFPVPILVTQHLPIAFMSYFAAQLSVLGGRPCDVATDRMRVRPGRIIIAPGDAHMRVTRVADGVAVRLTVEKAGSGCMPSVDPMFETVAEVFGARALGVILSGMGRDGSQGAKLLREKGGRIFVQDRESSVVWGMPGAAAKAGLATAVLPPDEIGHLIARGGRAA